MARLVLAVALSALAACQAPAEARLQAGDAAARAGQWQVAFDAWREAASLDQRSAVARTRLGFAAFELGRRVDAEAAWRAALAVEPGTEDALEGLARLALEASDAGAALEQLSVVTAPVGPSFQATLARALLARGGAGDAAAALLAAQRASAAAPGDPEADYLVGSAQVALRRFGDAQGTFEGLLRRQPKSPLGSYGLARLAAAQQRPTDALLHLAAARAAAGIGWNPARVAADPAFAFLVATPELRALLE